MNDTSLLIQNIRREFPFFTHNPDLCYMDSAATALKPQSVIDAVHEYDTEYSANIHRAVYDVSQHASDKYEKARKKVAQFLGVKTSEVIFTAGTTASINHFSHSFARAFLKEGDRIVVSQMEHHANLLPWQRIAEDFKCQLEVIPLLSNGELDLTKIDELLKPPTKLLSVTAISNTLGTINPIQELAKKAKEHDIYVFVDAAQSIPHFQFISENIDFMAFSGHKIFAPTGIGVFWGRKEHLKKMPPFFLGGGIVYDVELDKAIFSTAPSKFEAGTPPIAQAIGLAAAIEFVEKIGWETIHQIENAHLERGTEIFNKYSDFLRVYGTSLSKIPVFSFIVNQLHTHDVGSFLNEMNVAVRTGHQCTQPIWKYYGINSITRISTSIYNSLEEWDQVDSAIQALLEFFHVERFS